MFALPFVEELINLKTFDRKLCEIQSEKIRRSYLKTPNNNNVFAYDNEAIYLIDKLHITYECDYINDHCRILRKINNDRNFTYQISDNIILKKESGRERNYLYNYKIYNDDFLFGNIHMQNTSNYNLVKIEIANRILYTHKYLIETILNNISRLLELKYKNISSYDLARDSEIDYYDKMGNVYYQSDFCSNKVHEVYYSTPIYSFHGKKKSVIDFVDAKDNNYGTITLGKKSNNTRIKIYSKSKELKTWNEEKNYISEIHSKHFLKTDNISRVEVSVNSSIINQYNLSLRDLLEPSNHIALFRIFIGNRLRFKDLRSLYWDKNNNPKYHTIFDLIPTEEVENYLKNINIERQKSISHANNTNKFKNIIHQYLDEELTTSGIIGFIKLNILKKEVSIKKYLKELDKALNNYKGHIGVRERKKIKLIYRILNSKGVLDRILIALSRFYI